MDTSNKICAIIISMSILAGAFFIVAPSASPQTITPAVEEKSIAYKVEHAGEIIIDEPGLLVRFLGASDGPHYWFEVNESTKQYTLVGDSSDILNIAGKHYNIDAGERYVSLTEELTP